MNPIRPRGRARGAGLTSALLAALALAAARPASADAVRTRGARIPPEAELAVLVDRTGALGIGDVAAPPWADRFVATGGPASFGFGAPPLWVRFRLENDTDRARTYVLTWDFPLVERLDLFLTSGGAVTFHAQGGLSVPRAERTIEQRDGYHAVPVVLAPGERVLGFARAFTSGAALTGVSAWEPSALETRDRWLLLLLGTGAGVVLLLAGMGLYELALLRDPAYGLYVLFVLSYGGYAATVTGLAPRELWPASARLAMAAQPLFSGLTAFFGTAFARAFLATRTREPALDGGLRALAWANLAAGLLSLAHVTAANVATAVLAAVTLALTILAAIRCSRAGVRNARWLLAGFSAFAVFATALALTMLGVLRPYPFVLWGLQGSFCLTGAVLAIALSDRALGRARADRDLLERAVAERTRTLEEMVAALRAEAAERERAEAALRNSEERFRLAFKTSPDPIAINRASDGMYVAINDGFTRVTGYQDCDVLGRTSLDLGIWVDPADRVRMVETIGRDGAVSIEARFRRRDGTTLLGAMSARLMLLDGVPHVLTVTRDVTAEREAEGARRRLEEELRQAQKLEAIGRLAGGVAHDFNNLLTGITANVSLALMEARPDDPGRPLLEEIEDAATRAAGLTRQLLAFSRRQPLSPRRVSLNELVTDMRRLLGRLLTEDIRLELALGPELPAVIADAGQIEQVVLNLVLNARDALGGSGRIEITTHVRELREAGPDRLPGAYAVLAVRDTGLGMDPETRRRIFEPFFSTKADGKGTGLGLSTVYGIVQQHRGFVEVDSEPGRGSRFAVHLPVADGARSEAPGPALPRAPELPRGCETVLLVEDEPVVRDATRLLLERLGYSVLVASGGFEALSHAATHPGPIDLVVTDVVMPGMNGGELAARLRTARPESRVLFISGYDDEILGKYGLEGEGLDLLAKPFTVEALAERIRAALSRNVTA